MDTIGAICGVVPTAPADSIDRYLDRFPMLPSWPDLLVAAHRLAGGLSLPSLSA